MSHPSAPVALVADDDEFFRLALTAILTRIGFSEVIETGSFDAALDQLAQRGPAVTLALFDLAMPGMDGPASLSAVRECFPAVKVAVVSASSTRARILEALEVGVHGYVPKGLGAHELSRAIGTILDGQVFVPAVLATPEAGPGRPAESRAAPSRGLDGRGPDLTPRQRDVLALLVEGKSNKEIARDLNLGEGTVKVHMAALLRSLGVQNRAAAAVAGARLLAG
ncbi:LuxR C-terminal-related transcriptional regulator [Methylobacterium oryzihabitans]|uniref:Response regulator transcription factor n=1 Tax=Methylobacterium oryzihabitans TaxID=2499852 RepID=A0A3S2XHR1_9HYPH|nr:response regulator transcription factor [Methylobacterium oryzihabitans]RVU15145.1 response regulator transcription factor [Methylobacterium oryzihabitans]